MVDLYAFFLYISHVEKSDPLLKIFSLTWPGHRIGWLWTCSWQWCILRILNSLYCILDIKLN